jgi:hypothetical protein
MTAALSDRIFGARIAAASRAYIGTPWRHQGRSREGLDCAGLLILVSRDLGAEEADISHYLRNPKAPELTATLQARLAPLARADIFPGAVLEIHEPGAAHPIHVGVATEIGIVHACARARKVIEHRIDATFSRRIVRAYVWRPLSHEDLRRHPAPAPGASGRAVAPASTGLPPVSEGEDLAGGKVN